MTTVEIQQTEGGPWRPYALLTTDDEVVVARYASRERAAQRAASIRYRPAGMDEKQLAYHAAPRILMGAEVYPQASGWRLR